MSVPIVSGRLCKGPHDQPELRMLHLGRTAHLPTYRSLEFLLGHVFPLLPAEVLSRVRLDVAGSAGGTDVRSAHIRQLAAGYPRQVRLLGFVEDLDQLYATSDLQVVASTEATGLRTRIVESFAKGVPVLSTTTAATGILGLQPGTNILIADTAPGFAQVLAKLVSDRSSLARVSEHAYELYSAQYARSVVAACLQRWISTHVEVQV
jgi:polysaccharide biosynthesis protein PslH